ncbi:MAG: glycine C-acetyltransferase [Candidatus Levybacteria bacterium]|nr:glycine C-acetyltransferase [Candidatus Levybacteria bacterium]MBI3092912.1 glycine C-acetyltransferase [Candidatus Levybacteria bacterium]
MNQISAFYQKIDEAIKPGKRPLVVESAQGAYLTIESKKKLNFCSNNYLGFASNPRLKKAATDAIKKYGVGPGAVRALSGTNTLHIALEENLAKFKKAEAALVVQGGYIANLAAIQTLLGKEDIVISDELNHASIIDAIRLAQIKNKYIYKHRDMGDLEKVLNEIKELRKTPKSDNELPIVLIVTDGVFSMDGDLAPLPEIVALAKKYDALTMVDDAHGEGVLGDHGRGIVDHFNLHGEVDIDVGTLSKAFGVMGGFISGKRELIEYYRQKARQFLFSTGLTVPDTAALIEAVKILEESDKLVKKLWNNANYLKRRFKALSFDTGESETPITPVMLGDENVAIEFSAKLLENGVFATPIKFPMVPKGKARIRVMPSASHSKKDLDFGISVFHKVAKQLKVL